MKKSILIGLGACALALGGVAALVGQKGAIETKAEAAITDVVQYFDTTKKADWKDAGAVTKVWVSGSSTLADKWVDATNIKDNFYSFILPATYTTYTIARLNPADLSWSGNWGQFFDVTYAKEYNFINSTKWDEKMSYERKWIQHLSSGDHLYLTVSNNSYDWFSNSPISRLSFWGGPTIDGEIIGGSSTLRFSVASDVYATGFNIYRLNPSTEEAWNQTDNHEFTYENSSKNAFVIETNPDSWEHYLSGYTSSYDNAYLATSFGVHFLNTTKGICADGGENADHGTALDGKWAGLKSAYNALLSDSDKKAAFSSGSNEIVVNARNRYTHIIGRYTELEKFVSGVSATARVSSQMVSIEQNSGVYIMAASVGTVSLLAMAAVAFTKKAKKEQD